jgi:uncharacterized delta-60 repeat protein
MSSSPQLVRVACLLLLLIVTVPLGQSLFAQKRSRVKIIHTASTGDSAPSHKYSGANNPGTLAHVTNEALSTGLGMLQSAISLSFAEASYTVNEGDGTATFKLTRSGDTNGQVTAKVNLTNGTTSSADYHFKPGALDPTFASINAATPYYITQMALQPDGKLLVGFPLARFNPDGSPDASFNPGSLNAGVAAITVQRDGKILISGSFTTIDNVRKNKIARLNSDGSLDHTFDAGAGLNDWANAMIEQPDGKILIAGYFNSVNLTSRPGVARLNADGSLDATFQPTNGFTCYSMALQPDGKVLVAGPYPGVLRYNSDGSLDNTFTLNVSYPTYAVVLQPDGKILIGGAFSQVGSAAVYNVARLDANGNLDPSFNPGTGPSSAVNTLALQPDGKVLIAGTFNSVNGVPTSRIARLNSDGSLDPSFNAPGGGGNASIYAIRVQPNGKIIIGGSFTMIGNNFNRSTYARLDGDLFVSWADGDASDKLVTLPITDDLLDEPDETLNLSLTPLTPGVSAEGNATATLRIVDNDVPPTFTSALPQSLVTKWTSYNHTFVVTGHPASTFSVTAGTLPPGLFLSTGGQIFGTPYMIGTYNITVTASNGVAPTASQTFSIRVNAMPVANFNNYNLSEDGSLTVAAPGVLGNDSDEDGDTLTPTLLTSTANGTLTFNSDGSFSYTPNANYYGTDSFTYRVSDGNINSSPATVSLSVSPVNDAPVNTVPGAQTTIESHPISFSTANGNVLSVADLDVAFGFMRLTLTATGGAITLPSTNGLFFSVGDGTADARMIFSGRLASVNAALDGLTFIPANGFSGTATLQINTNDEGNTGPGALSDTDTVSISVLEAGAFQFNTATYSVNENAGSTTITVTRTGGSAGAVSVNYATSNGTATAGADYTSASGTLTFAEGELTKTFNVAISEDAAVEGSESLNLQLTNPTGGASLGSPASAVLTILENDSCSYSINPSSRTSPPAGETLTVNVTAPVGCNWTAVSNDSFISVTAGANGNGNGVVSLSVIANGSGVPRVGTVTIAGQTFTLTQPELIPEVPLIYFGQGDFQVDEGAGRAILYVTRRGNVSGTATVDYLTSDDPAAVPCDPTIKRPDGSDYPHGSAYARCDYATTIDTLTFAPGESVKEIYVPIIDDAHVEGDERVQVRLRNVTGVAVLVDEQSSAILLISDNDQAGAPNPIFSTPFFVRMHYLDFLSREPEANEPWSGVLNRCPNVFNLDPLSASAGCDRLIVSQSFFGSQEFRLKGIYTYTFYRVAFGRLAEYTEVIRDMRTLSGTTAEQVYARRAALPVSFTARQEFKTRYDALSDTTFVNALLDPYGLQQITTPDPQQPEGSTRVVLTRTELITRLGAAAGTAQALTRAQVLRAVVESTEVGAIEYNGAFVAMQYYGYLRRTPEEAGYQAWLRVINQDPNNVRIMVNGFMNSTEYRLRFGSPTQ